jgi:hypothetical protein
LGRYFSFFLLPLAEFFLFPLAEKVRVRGHLYKLGLHAGDLLILVNGRR